MTIEASKYTRGPKMAEIRPAIGVMLVMAIKYVDVNQLTSVDALRSMAIGDCTVVIRDTLLVRMNIRVQTDTHIKVPLTKDSFRLPAVAWNGRPPLSSSDLDSSSSIGKLSDVDVDADADADESSGVCSECLEFLAMLADACFPIQIS